MSVDDEPEATDVGAKESVIPDGAPLAEKATLPGEPETTAVFTESVLDAPSTTVSDEAPSATEKSFGGGGGGAVTVSETLALCEPVAAVPVTVIE